MSGPSSYDYLKCTHTRVLRLATALHDWIGYRIPKHVVPVHGGSAYDTCYIHVAPDDWNHRARARRAWGMGYVCQRYIADKLHAMGLKLGVYTDLTDHSCGTGPGSKGHYISDANTFAHDWEVS